MKFPAFLLVTGWLTHWLTLTKPRGAFAPKKERKMIQMPWNKLCSIWVIWQLPDDASTWLVSSSLISDKFFPNPTGHLILCLREGKIKIFIQSHWKNNGSNFFLTKSFWDPNFFWTNIFWESFWMFFLTKIFLSKFCLQNFFHQFRPYISFLTKITLEFFFQTGFCST